MNSLCVVELETIQETNNVKVSQFDGFELEEDTVLYGQPRNYLYPLILYLLILCNHFHCCFLVQNILKLFIVTVDS